MWVVKKGKWMNKKRKKEQRRLKGKTSLCHFFTSFLITPMAMYDHLPAEHCRAGAGCRSACLTLALPGPHPPAAIHLQWPNRAPVCLESPHLAQAQITGTNKSSVCVYMSGLCHSVCAWIYFIVRWCACMGVFVNISKRDDQVSVCVTERQQSNEGAGDIYPSEM